MDLRLYNAAATGGSVDCIKKLEDENPILLLGVTPGKNTVLHLAAKFGREALVKEVCGRCESLIAMRNSKGDTALHIAARTGHIAIVKFLVEKFISRSTFIGKGRSDILRIRNEGKNTALHEALRYRHSDVVEELTEWYPKLWLVVNTAGESPLYLAAKGGLKEIACKVLKSSQPYAHQGPNGLTALHAATIWDHYGITELLVELRPELITKKDNYGRTALHYAASYLKIGIAKLLLQSNSSVAFIQDKEGRSPLHFAAGKGNTWTITQIIQLYPDAVDLVDKNGQNAIHVCIGEYNNQNELLTQCDHMAVLDCFMSSEVWRDDLLNQQDNDGNTPLHLAVNRGSDLVRSLLKKYEGRLDTDALNKKNNTPLDLAISRKEALSKEENQVYKQLLSFNCKFSPTRPLENRHLRDKKGIVEEYITRTKEINSTHMLVAILIATVTFAATFQVPGGYKSDGTPTLGRKVAFKAFVVTDSMALSCSMTAVILNFIIPYIHDRWPLKVIKIVAILTLIASVLMLIAFVAGMYVVLTNILWLAILTFFNFSAIFSCFLIFWIISRKSADYLPDADAFV